MKKDLERVEKKIDKVDERLDAIDNHLSFYNGQLEVHIKASKANGKRLIHVEKHVTKVNFVMKIIGAVALTILGAWAKSHFGL